MANYTFDEAITVVKAFVKNAPTTSMQTVACDQAYSRIWFAYPWEWTLGALTAIPLVDGTQDYTVSNNDFFKLVEARITRTDLTPDEYQELNILEFMPPELAIKIGWQNFQSISRDPRSAKLRLEAAASVPSGVTMQIDGVYQKYPAKLTATTGNLVSPDYHFQTFLDWLTYYFYKFTDDSRAGGVAVSKATGEKTYSGQLAVAMDSLTTMIATEDARDGTGYLFPDNPLGAAG